MLFPAESSKDLSEWSFRGDLTCYEPEGDGDGGIEEEEDFEEEDEDEEQYDDEQNIEEDDDGVPGTQ